MANINNKLLSVLCDGLRIYFTNILTFTKYMLFPVIGQVVGLILIFWFTNLFSNSLPYWMEKFQIFDNMTVILLSVILVALPGMIIFIKAFWDYLVAYGALNSMTEAVLSTGKLYDLKAHTQVVTNRTFKFVALLFVISILSLIGLFPPFWALGVIFFIFFILVFQVFALEQEASIYECFRRSLFLVKGNYAQTVALAILLFTICFVLLTWCTEAFLGLIKISDVWIGVFESWAATLPLNEVNTSLAIFRAPIITPNSVANQVFESIIFFIIAGFTLPLRSVVWTLWYKNLAQIKDNVRKKAAK